MPSKIFKLIEPFLFLAVTLYTLAPLFGSQFFPTLDGPAHLYNSNLINHLLFGNSDYLHQFFKMNPEPVPNWTGHLFLSFFNLWLPANIADKIVLFIYLVGFPYAFRYVLKANKPHNIILSYAIFPFVYSFVFLFGFYNFSLSLVLLLTTIGYWLRIREQRNSRKQGVILAVLFLFSYFSHVFTFMLLIMLIGLHIVLEIFASEVPETHRKNNMQTAVKKLKYLFITASVPLILLIYHLYTQPVIGSPQFLDTSKLLYDLWTISATTILVSEVETPLASNIFLILAALFVAAVLARLWTAIKLRKSAKHTADTAPSVGFQFRDYWLIAAGIFLLMYFVLPDSNGSGGYISVRLALLFFILMITWFATQRIPLWFSGLAIAVILFFHYQYQVFYAEKLIQLSNVAKNCSAASNAIRANSIVLPLNYNTWITGHFSNYLGTEKPMVILDNYEATVGYFPVQWNDEHFPQLLFGNKTSGELECLHWKSNPENQAQVIDYVFILGSPGPNTDECVKSMENTLEKYYRLVYKNRDCKVYKYKDI